MPFCPIVPVLPTFSFTGMKNRMSQVRGVEKPLVVSDKEDRGCVPKFSVQMYTNWQ